MFTQSRPPDAPRSAARLTLDRLDDRIVPTVVFRPAFGAETITAGSGYHALSSPPLELVFAGGYWNTAAGAWDRAAMIAATRTLVNGPYLSALAQYGGDGKATLGATWTEANGLANKFSDADIQGLLQRVIDNRASPIPRPTTPANTPLYLVITPPGVKSHLDDAAGYNSTNDYSHGLFGWSHDALHTLWIGNTATAAGRVNMDEFGSVLSHEIAEAMSDPDGNGIHVTAPAGLPTDLKEGHQIGDLEPAVARYAYKLNGVNVQPYWSARDSAFIVPDGNRQNFYLDPLWSAKDASGHATFSHQFDLTLQGDQLGANYNDRIATNRSANDSNGISATMNGETANFNEGQIKNVTIDTGGGSNAVNVNYAVADTKTVVQSSGGMAAGGYALSRDTVNVGGGYMSNIKGTVSVSNASGTTALSVDDSKDAAPQSAHVTSRAVQFAGDGVVNYTPGSPSYWSGQQRGVTALRVFKGAAGTVAVDSQEPTITTSVNGVLQSPIIHIPIGPIVLVKRGQL